MNTTIKRQAAVAALATVALFASSPAGAESYDTYRPRGGGNAHYTADGQLVDVQVRVDGSTAPFYFRPGHRDRHYFQAFKGQNYSLVIRNNTGRRTGVLIAVDGLNVVNGERSHLSRNESMYVLDPYEEAVIQGWRSSLHDVRRFVFVDEERSYAERTGQANGDMGWIRVMSFREDRPLSFYRPAPKVRERGNGGYGQEYDGDDEVGRNEEAPSAPESQSKARDRAGSLESEGRAMAPDANPGTGWGDRRHDPVQQTVFRAVRHATDQIVMRYEYAKGLRALGIFPSRSRLSDRERGELGFAQPPRW